MGIPTDALIREELSAVPTEERQPGKVSPTQAGLTCDTRDPQHQCGTCIRFVTDERCTQVGQKSGQEARGEIKKIGSCNFWVFGPVLTPGKAQELAAKVGRVLAGYKERVGGFQCGGCIQYDAEAKRCKQVYGWYKGPGGGDIHADWCCNLWTDGQPWILPE